MIYTRNKISSYAREWVGTPFHSCGRIKGVGCDCIGLIICIAKEFQFRSLENEKLLSEMDIEYYQCIDDSPTLERQFEKHLIKTNSAKVGSVVLMKNTSYCHAGILGDYQTDSGYLSLIHASTERMMVIEHRFISDSSYTYFDFKEIDKLWI